MLDLADSSEYDPGDTVEINGVRKQVASTDVEAGTVTLTSTLGAAADIGDRVYVISGGEVAYDYALEVHLSDGEPVEIPVDFSDRALWGEPGPIDPPIPVTISDDLTTIVDVPGRRALINPAATEAPLFVGYLDVDQSIPTGAGFTTVQDWQTQILRGGITYDPAFDAVVVPIPGWYSVTSSAVAWQFNATGRRAVQPMFTTLAGMVGGGLYKQDASPDPVQQTTPVVSPLLALEAGETVSLMVADLGRGAEPGR